MIAAPYPPVDGTQPCAGLDHLFFPDTLRAVPNDIKRICRNCPFHDPCLAYAVSHVVDGIWAGTTPGQRTKMREAAA